MLVAAVAVLGVVAGLAAFVLVGAANSDRGEQVRSGAAASPSREDRTSREDRNDGPRDEETGAASGQDEDRDDDVDPAVVQSPTSRARPSGDGIRSATLYSGDAKIRSSPDLGGAEVARISGRDRAPMEVIGDMDDNGWYRVRIDDSEGYLFGAFVLPPAYGSCVGQLSAGSVISLDDGTMVGSDENPSGSKILMSGEPEIDSGLAAVLLADGRYGTVDDGTYSIEDCGEEAYE